MFTDGVGGCGRTWNRSTSSAGDPRAVVRRIALDVRYAVGWPIRLPVRFATPPAGLKPMAYLVSVRANDR
ncbi:hypothetical protein [Micromonospora purpureochromogenes]|uniref:Uncharacterized protein n=1 Tax=Micromonospora purpureochromogenes TaxID=47872 RepID=A0ABX2RJH8_9ACTN|nr:hypothetical protein [Micromonospora purpureochromogenes]NYF56305.1 hypothetical protein [Micromonospora purpureochromogenes]